MANSHEGKKFVGAWVPRPLHTALKTVAAREDRSLQYILVKMMQRGVDHLMKEALSLRPARRGKSK